MKTAILFIVLVIGCFTISYSETEAPDIRVELPEGLMPRAKPLSENEQKVARLRASVNARLPYVARGDFALGSLGQLSKLSDNVIIGKVINMKETQDETHGKFVGVALGIETNLFGEISNKAITIILNVQEQCVQPMKSGDHILVFLANDDYGNYIYDALSFDFEKTATRSITNNTPRVVCDGRGIFSLNNDADEREILAATEGFLCVLRREKRNAEAYYALLRKLILSPVPRIKEDARSDLLFFIIKTKSFDPHRILDDDNVDDGIRDYVRLILLPSRQPPRKQ